MADVASPGQARIVAGRYRLTSVVGRGGMGTVWRAVDEMLHREVAVKELRLPDHLDDEERDIQQQRTLREARTAARIGHENVITIYDVVEDGGIPWIVMELVEAESLADILKTRGTLSPAEAAEVGLKVLNALLAAEAKGVLHRDVKPANILVTVSGRVVLTDFGIATEAGSATLTATGMLVGSPNFLAPERAQGLRPNLSADLWSLGLVLYMAVEGRNPFDRPTMISTLNSILTEEPDPPRRAGLLRPVIEGLLQKDPDRRLPAKDVDRMLSGVVRGDLTQSHPRAVPQGVPNVGLGAVAGLGAEAGGPDSDPATPQSAPQSPRSGPPSAPPAGSQPGAQSGSAPGPHSGPHSGQAGPYSGPPSGPPSGPQGYAGAPTLTAGAAGVPPAPGGYGPPHGTYPGAGSGYPGVPPQPTGSYGAGPYGSGAPHPDSGPGVAWPSAEYVTGHTAPDTRTNPSGPPPRASRKPLVLGVTALVIAVVAAGVVAVVVLKGKDDKSDNASGPGVPTASPTASASPGPQPGPGAQTGPTSSTQPTLTPPSGASRPPIVPPTGASQGSGNDPAPIAGYTWTHDPAGFSLFVPNGWTRNANGNQIDYTDPNKRTLLRIGTDTVGKAPLDNFNEIDANFAKIKQNYVRLQLGPHPIGVPGWDAAVWEFTWKGNPFNPQSGDLRPSHAMDLGIRTDRGSDYAIYVASFEENWASSQKVFTNAVANFRQD